MQGFSALHRKSVNVKRKYGSRSVITKVQGKVNTCSLRTTFQPLYRSITAAYPQYNLAFYSSESF